MHAAYLGTPQPRVLLTRTVVAPTIAEGYRVLNAARTAQNRSTAWRNDFIRGLGRIEIVRTTDDDGWIVHAHEIAILRSTTIASAKHAKIWARLIGAEGRTGTFDARVIDEATAAYHGQPFSAPRDGTPYYVTKRKISVVRELSDDALAEYALAVPRRTRDKYLGLRCGVRFGRSAKVTK